MDLYGMELIVLPKKNKATAIKLLNTKILIKCCLKLIKPTTILEDKVKNKIKKIKIIHKEEIKHPRIIINQPHKHQMKTTTTKNKKQMETHLPKIITNQIQQNNPINQINKINRTHKLKLMNQINKTIINNQLLQINNQV